MRRWAPVRVLAAMGVAGASVLGLGVTHHGVASVVPHPFAHEIIEGASFQNPPTTAECVASAALHHRHCYNPIQFANAYGLKALHDAGIDGTGMTIVIVDSFGSPTIENDLKAFDAAFNIPDPPSFEIRQDGGTPVPPFDPTNGDMTGWAAETTLDVEWSHVFAPGAKILLEETPVSETEGVQGFPEIVKAENYVIDHNLGDVISQSFGATEETFPSKQSLLDLRGSFKNAREHHVTVLASSGDTGATNFQVNGDLYTFPVNSWPSSDPLVTSIGGTMLTLDAQGNRLNPDVVWHDFAGAAGGGLSHVFEQPDFQSRVENVVGDARGTPDISMSAAVDGDVVYYHTYLPTDLTFDPNNPIRTGPWHLVAGTSEACPLFAGVVAMADQVAGHRLGNINEALYRLHYGEDGLVDVTQGNISFGPFTNSDGITYTVTGPQAGPGYDLASGLGTVDASKFVPALARSEGGDDRGDGGGGGGKQGD